MCCHSTISTTHAIEAIDQRLKWAMQIIESAYQGRPPELAGTLQEARSAPLTPEEAARLQGLSGVQTAMSREVITTSPFFAEREQEFRRILGIELDAETLAALRQLQYTPRLRQGIMRCLGGGDAAGCCQQSRSLRGTSGAGDCVP